MNLAAQHFSGQLRPAYLVPEVLKWLVFGCEVVVVTVTQLIESVGALWEDQAIMVFGAPG